MIVDRNSRGRPRWDDLLFIAEMTGGGQQTPGFIASARSTFSRRNSSAPMGGWRGWCGPHAVKQKLGDKLRQRCEEIGQPELYGKIADETICTELEPLIEHWRLSSIRAGAGEMI